MLDIALRAEVCWRLTYALGHVIGIGIAVGLVSFAANRVLQTASATSRYVVNLVALSIIFVCLPLSIVFHVGPDAETRHAPFQPESTAKALSTEPNSESETLSVLSDPQKHVPQPRPSNLVGATSSDVPVNPANADWQTIAARTITVLYLVGVACMLLRLGIGVYASGRLKLESEPVRNVTLLSRIESQLSTVGIASLPPIAASKKIAGPILVGFFRPMILLPVSMVTFKFKGKAKSLAMHSSGRNRAMFDMSVVCFH